MHFWLSEVFKIYDLRENDNRCSTKKTISSYIMMNTSTIRCPKPKYDNGCQYFSSWQVGLGNEYWWSKLKICYYLANIHIGIKNNFHILAWTPNLQNIWYVCKMKLKSFHSLLRWKMKMFTDFLPFLLESIYICLSFLTSNKTSKRSKWKKCTQMMMYQCIILLWATIENLPTFVYYIYVY